jgi:Ca2+/H+ antiporter, TMEM165/GDT1 family
VTQHAVWGLVVATFVAAFVEFVEALTIVLAMGITRGWRSALAGTAGALAALAAFTAVLGYALATWLPRSSLQLVVGVLLLIFGLQWLRKAILRSAGLKALHDEDDEYREQTAAARAATRRSRFGLDWFGFVVSFKGVFLEGVEVVFIVITFGLNARNVPAAAASAVAAAVLVTALGVAASRPLSAVPENMLKYAVGLMLATYGTFWAVKGLGALHGGTSLDWPGEDLALFAILAGWLLLSRALVALLPRLRSGPAPAAATLSAVGEGER